MRAVALVDQSSRLLRINRRLRADAGRLRREATDLRRQVGWRLAGRWRPISGGSEADPHDLAAVIRAKLTAGVLPRDHPGKMWVGPGSGKACDGCGETITKEQREYEFDPAGWRTICLHQGCLKIWHMERMSMPVEGSSSSTPDTPVARMGAFLHDCQPSTCCVECLATKLLLPIKEARDAAQVLVVRPGFRVVADRCYVCGQVRDCTVAFVAGR